MKNMKFTQMKPDQIDLDDQRFRIPSFSSLGSLIPSIKKAGILNPPVVTTRSGKIIAVSGFRRIIASRKLSLPMIPVFVLKETSDREAFKIPLYENLSVRDYTPIEIASIIKKLHDFGEPPQSIVRTYLPLFKSPPKREVMDVYISIHHLSEDIKEIAYKKQWPFSTLELMTNFTEKENKALYPFLKAMSLNKQKQLIENLFDISRKRDISVQDLLSSDEFSFIQNDKSLSSVQKAEEIFELTRQKRNPLMSMWRDSFQKACENLDLPEEITVIPSKYFEGDTLSLKLDFKSRSELKKSIQKLKELSDKKEITLLLDPLSHD
ncbi:MAG: hypothetical protein GF421_05435 [Candidatus Aminicenantes bacterium]|nr:hypothetical protein [Candidatus Aminicenantes bacterium]